MGMGIKLSGDRRKNPKLLIGVNRIGPPNVVHQVRPEFKLNPAIRVSDKIVSSLSSVRLGCIIGSSNGDSSSVAECFKDTSHLLTTQKENGPFIGTRQWECFSGKIF